MRVAFAAPVADLAHYLQLLSRFRISVAERGNNRDPSTRVSRARPPQHAKGRRAGDPGYRNAREPSLARDDIGYINIGYINIGDMNIGYIRSENGLAKHSA